MKLNKTTSGVYFVVLPKSLYKTLDITTLFTEPGNKEILFLTARSHSGKGWNGFKGAMKEIHSEIGEVDYEQSVLLIARYL